MIDRSQQPPLHDLKEFNLLSPQGVELPNSVKLWILDVGDVDVTRVDLAGIIYKPNVA